MTGPVVPPPDPIGLPAPPGLLQGLLVFTFFLHVLPLAMTVGGAVITLASEVAGRQGHGHHQRLARELAAVLPASVAYTITFGVAPLLFVQVLYGVFFFTSSIILGWLWFLMIPAMIVAYYGLYLVAWFRERVGRAAPLVLAVAGLLILYVAAMHAKNQVLMAHPEWWPGRYFGPAAGPTPVLPVLPRLAHAFFGLLGLAGLAVSLYGHRVWRADREYGRWVARSGLAWVLGAAAAQIVVAPWYWLTLPAPIQSRVLAGGLGGGLLLAAPLLAALGVGLLALAAAAMKPGPAIAAGVAMVGATAALVGLRDLVRQLALLPHLPAGAWALALQVGPAVMFAVVLLAGLALVGYLLARVAGELRAPPVPPPAPVSGTAGRAPGPGPAPPAQAG